MDLSNMAKIRRPKSRSKILAQHMEFSKPKFYEYLFFKWYQNLRILKVRYSFSLKSIRQN